MSGFFAVLRREVAERRLLLLAAAAAGLFPLVAPYLPGIAGRNAAELRGDTALALGLVVAVVLSLVLGASVIAGDLAERRLGFYFSRPIAGWAVWAGKLAGAAVLAAGASMLVLLPSLLLGGKVEVGTTWWMGSVWAPGLAVAGLLVTAGTVAVVALSHVASSMARSRSPWLLLDLAAAFVLAGVVWSCWRVLWYEGAAVALIRGLGGLAAALVVAAIVAGAVQVTAGRTDTRRGHRLLSLTFWTGLGLAGLAFAAYTRWVVTPAPEDLVDIEQVLAAPRGSWIALRGLVGGRGAYATGFLYDTASGRWLKLNARSWFRPWLAFSEDGTRAAWLEPGQDGGFDLKTLDLAQPGARPAAPPVSYREMPRELLLSPEGTRLAVLQEDGRLTVADLATGRLLAAGSLPGLVEGSVDLGFAGPDRLRILRLVDQPSAGTDDDAHHQLVICELGIPRGRIAVTGRAEITESERLGSVSYEGERAVLYDGRSRHLVDLQSGALLPMTGIGFGPAFLADGRLVAIERAGGRLELRLFTRDGAPLRRFSFHATHLLVGGEPVSGRLVLATASRPAAKPPDWTAFLLDVSSGRTTSLGRGLLPARFTAVWTRLGADGFARGLGARLFIRIRKPGDKPELVLLEPSGRLRTLLGDRRGDGS